MSKKKPAEPPAIAMHPCQRFVSRDMKRSEIREVDYNPRHISDKARAKLRGALDITKGGLGLLNAVVWNQRSEAKGWEPNVGGGLVGGHQRLKILDALADGAPDYILTVDVVDLTASEEREANVLLNNQELAGGFDLEKMAALINDTTIPMRVEAAGFDTSAMFRLYGGSNPYTGDVAAEKQREIGDQAREAQRKYREAQAYAKDRNKGHNFLVLYWPTQEAALAAAKAIGITDPVSGSTLIAQDGPDFMARVREAEALPPAPPVKCCPRCGRE